MSLPLVVLTTLCLKLCVLIGVHNCCLFPNPLTISSIIYEIVTLPTRCRLQGKSQIVQDELVRLGEQMVNSPEGTRALALELCREFEDKFLQHITSGEVSNCFLIILEDIHVVSLSIRKHKRHIHFYNITTKIWWKCCAGRKG